MSDDDCVVVKHVVQKNDTLMGIALKYNMKVDDLKKLNKLFAGNVFEGQQLDVRVKKGNETIAAPLREESSSSSLVADGNKDSIVAPSPSKQDLITYYKLSTSVPNTSFVDLLGIPLSQYDKDEKTSKRSSVWNMAGITKAHEIVTSYAKYVPVHQTQVFGILTITPTRVIFEPNLDDPEVIKDGVLAHQFSVATDRLLDVEIFFDPNSFHEKLSRQLEDQAPWENSRKSTDSNKIKPRKDSKAEKIKKTKGKKTSKGNLIAPSAYFDPTSEEMLQIVCSGRFRPKNYANFILPKDKANAIKQRVVVFLSGSKEERLKACLNLDVSAPRPKHKLRRQPSFSNGDFAGIIADLQLKHKKKQASILSLEQEFTTPIVAPPAVTNDQPTPKSKKERSKEEPQDVDTPKSKKLDEAKLGKELKKEKKSPKEGGKRRGSFSDRIRSWVSDKSPPTSPPTSPTLRVNTGALIEPSLPALDISDKKPSPDILDALDDIVVISSDKVPSQQPKAPKATHEDEDETDLPVMLGESLIIKETDMHQLRRYLPGYTKWLDWKLLYSTQVHGISFSTFQYKIKNHSPTLLIMEDSNGFVFGGYATAPWAISTGYFGTGQSFLFSLKPKLHVYEWTRANPFFMLMTSSAIAMGGDKEGRHGFWVDSNFEFGASEVCSTYFNRCLASSERFKCAILEVWTFTENRPKM